MCNLCRMTPLGQVPLSVMRDLGVDHCWSRGMGLVLALSKRNSRELRDMCISRGVPAV